LGEGVMAVPGFIGFVGDVESVEMELIEDVMLELRGTDGIMRIDLTRDELKKTLRKGKR